MPGNQKSPVTKDGMARLRVEAVSSMSNGSTQAHQFPPNGPSFDGSVGESVVIGNVSGGGVGSANEINRNAGGKMPPMGSIVG